MSQPGIPFHPLMRWVSTSRSHSMRLNIEADGLLAQLTDLQQRQQKIDDLAAAPLTLGLYGTSVAGKHHLLKMILSEGRDEIDVLLGGNPLNYLRHINPENTVPLMAVRFTTTPAIAMENLPLLLTLFSESELAQRLIVQYHSSRHPHIVADSKIRDTLKILNLRRQPHEIPGMSSTEFMSVIRCYHQRVHSSHRPGDALIYQMAQLIPFLALADRAALLSMLWGEHIALTSQWQQQAQKRHYLGNAMQVLAPASLVVDHLLLPNKGFLIPASDHERGQNQDVIVCPLHDGVPGNRLSISQQDLASLSAGITFTLSRHSSLSCVDIVDIPADQLPQYQENLQPDTLLICNSTAGRQNRMPVVRALTDWLSKTQTQKQHSLPRLVWAITPFDARFTHGHHADEVIQRMITQSGKQWGTLQALDNRDMPCLNDWLSAAMATSCREARVNTLRDSLRQQTAAQFRHFTSGERRSSTQYEALIRVMQTQIARHGNLISSLMLSRTALHESWLQHQQTRPHQPVAPLISIDLFDEPETVKDVIQEENSYAAQVFAQWVNHLSQLSGNTAVANASGLGSHQLASLCDILVTTSYRLGLPALLEEALEQKGAETPMAVTYAGNVLNDFVSWLGYHRTREALRPKSRVQKDSAIFTPAPQASANQRLTQLGVQTSQGNERYIYDWLVALLTRAKENEQCPHSDDISTEHREILKTLLS